MNPHREAPPPDRRFTRSAYHLPAALAARVLLSMALGRRRDLAADAGEMLKPPCPTPKMEGGAHIPPAGPFLLVMNHYSRPGLDSWWPAALATWAVGQIRSGESLQWLMTSEWAWPAWQYHLIITPISRLVFARMAAVYGLVRTPPVLNLDYGPNQGARAVLGFLSAARQAAADGSILAIAPEGRDSADGSLTTLPPGAGRFLVLLAGAGLPCLPTAVREDPPGSLLVQFDLPFHLRAPASLRRDALDEWAGAQVMGRLATMLPAGMRGPYAPVVPPSAAR